MGWPFSGKNGLVEKVFLPLFQEQGEGSIRFLCESRASRMAFLSEYKRLPPIEEMPEKEKKEMKLYVIGLFPDKTPEEKLEYCKIIYTIGTLL